MSTEEVVPADVDVAEESEPVQGSRLLESILKEVEARQERANSEYNERYIDKGPAWREHINYSDGGHHGQTHRNGRP